MASFLHNNILFAASALFVAALVIFVQMKESPPQPATVLSGTTPSAVQVQQTPASTPATSVAAPTDTPVPVVSTPSIRGRYDNEGNDD